MRTAYTIKEIDLIVTSWRRPTRFRKRGVGHAKMYLPRCTQVQTCLLIWQNPLLFGPRVGACPIVPLRPVEGKGTAQQRANPNLRVHRGRQEEERKLCGGRWKETGMVFTTTVGTMLDPRNMLRSYYAIMSAPDPNDPEPDPKKKRKLLPRLRLHDLRHSAATLLLAQGVHARYIMELLGHSSITLTMNTYGHVLEEMQRETARQTDAVFNPPAVKLAVKPVAERVN